MNQEIYVFLSAMGSGVITGFIYDLFRLKRKALKTRAFLIGLEDIIFWILIALLVFITAYFSNQGEVRPYFFIAVIVGVSVYYWLLSHWVIEILSFLVKVIVWPFAFLIRVLKPPAKWLYAFIGKGTVKTKGRLHLSQIKLNRRIQSIRHIIRKI